MRGLDDAVVAGTFRAAEGSFDVQDFLDDDGVLALDASGQPSATGVRAADLYVHVPASVADAPAGSVPVLLFGHGIFSEPANYLDDADDPSAVVALADELGAIVVGTTWRGLSWDDRVVAIEVAGDFGRIPRITDRLVQAQVDIHTLAAMLHLGDLLDDPVFTGSAGQSLPMRGRLVYYGISLGGIEGAVFVASGAPVEAAVLHVGGSMWSTMLERSSNWTTFEGVLVPAIEDPGDRQRLYALSQLFWDPVDPLAWAGTLDRRPVLLQESVGDEQVPNLTTQALARSADLVFAQPGAGEVAGLASATMPLPAGSRAYVRYDPEVGEPADVNRPAPVSGAHYLPRVWRGHRAAVVDFLGVGTEGSVRHHCGDAACTASNPG